VKGRDDLLPVTSTITRRTPFRQLKNLDSPFPAHLFEGLNTERVNGKMGFAGGLPYFVDIDRCIC